MIEHDVVCSPSAGFHEPDGVSLGERREPPDLAFAVNITTAKAPAIEILSEGGNTLLRLNRVDGRLVADYDPADLDEAAQQFVRAIERIG